MYNLKPGLNKGYGALPSKTFCDNKLRTRFLNPNNKKMKPFQIPIMLCTISMLLLSGYTLKKKLTVASTATLLEGVAKSAF